YGWGKFSSSNYLSYGFTGTGCTLYRNFPERNLSVIFLANGFSIWHNMDYLSNNLANIIDKNIVDKDALFSEKLLSSFLKGGITLFKEAYLKMKTDERYKDIDYANHLINIGFIFLDTEKTTQSIDVFKFYKEEFADSWYAYNCLGLAFEQNNQDKKALINYQEALELNTENQNEYNSTLIERIERLKNYPI
ncbi:MAG: tetratricopeptide repeat protein, partial [Bacteroidota bacterium]